MGFPGVSVDKGSACNVGDCLQYSRLGSIPGMGRSPGEGKGFPLQYSPWRIPWIIQFTGSQRVRHDWATFTWQNWLWKILQEMGIPDHLACLLRNLYAGQEATVRTGQGTKDWFKIWKGVHWSCILSSCLFNLYTEYIMRNTGLEEAQTGIKIAWRNINNLRYADDTTLWQKVKKN